MSGVRFECNHRQSRTRYMEIHHAVLWTITIYAQISTNVSPSTTSFGNFGRYLKLLPPWNVQMHAHTFVGRQLNWFGIHTPEHIDDNKSVSKRLKN